jgi:hypothetical protein
MLDLDTLFPTEPAPPMRRPDTETPAFVPACPGMSRPFSELPGQRKPNASVGFGGFVPVVPVVPVEKARSGKKEEEAGARAARRTDELRATETPQWLPLEAERTQAAFLVASVFTHANDTEADRAEAFDLVLESRELFEWLHLRSGRPAVFDDREDNRRPCACCRNLTESGRCLAASRREIAARLPYCPPRFLLQRCPAYLPAAGDPDPRPALERWPGLCE